MAWQFFVLQFWLNVQHANPLTVALYLTPNAIFGVLATFIVSRIAHLVAGHWILAASMLAFALGPVFFLPQTANTTYWALSMPGIAVATFGPVGIFSVLSYWNFVLKLDSDRTYPLQPLPSLSLPVLRDHIKALPVA
jgi:hypothetical protein